MIIAEFTEKQPQYRYMKIDDEYADVFIYSFIEEKETFNEVNLVADNDESDDNEYVDNNIEDVKDDGDIQDDVIDEINTVIPQMVYIYDMNVFRCKQIDITEDMVKEDPMKYLDYELHEEKEIDNAELAHKISSLEKQQQLADQALQELILTTLSTEV